MNDNFVLYVIDGDYGLPSLDVECIQSILYAKICKVPLQIKLLNARKPCALYSAPTLINGKKKLNNIRDIILHFRDLDGNIDTNLTVKQASESLALTNYVVPLLRPVIDFIFWLDQRNCDEFSSRWFIKALPFPFCYTYVNRMKKNAEDLIKTTYPVETDLEVIKEFINKSAMQCLSTLSTRLGSSMYFYDDKPTSLDVLVYSHIAPLIKLPFPSNEVASLMTMWPNLADFVKRIDSTYFPELKREVKYLKTEETVKTNDDEVSYAAIFILLVSTGSLVVGFALRKGFIKFPWLQ